MPLGEVEGADSTAIRPAGVLVTLPSPDRWTVTVCLRISNWAPTVASSVTVHSGPLAVAQAPVQCVALAGGGFCRDVTVVPVGKLALQSEPPVDAGGSADDGSADERGIDLDVVNILAFDRLGFSGHG
jgi:hypothetical protein